MEIHFPLVRNRKKDSKMGIIAILKIQYTFKI